MIELFRSAVIDHPIEKVWDAVRDFNGLAAWEPEVTESIIEGGIDSATVGAVRNFVLTDGAHIREELLELNDLDHKFSYRILDSSLPLIDYVAHSQFHAITIGNKTLFTRRASFYAPPGQENEARELILGVMDSSFTGLRSLLENKPTKIHKRRSSKSSFDLKGIAISSKNKGAPELLEQIDISAPAPAADEVRLQQTAIGVNFIDIYCRRGTLNILGDNGVLGFEAVGVVEEIGEQVNHIALGDRVAYIHPQPGAYASVRTIPAAMVMRIPNRINDEDVAASLLKGITANYLTCDVSPLTPDDTVVVYAAAGGTGSLLTQFAAASGARVIGIVSQQGKADFVRQCKANDVVVAQEGDIAEAVLALTNSKGASVVFDAIGQDTFKQSLSMLAPRGHLVSFGQASGPIGSVDVDALTEKSIRLSRPNFFDYVGTASQLNRHAKHLFELIAQDKIKINIASRFPLVDAASAHRALEGRSNCGAIVLTL